MVPSNFILASNLSALPKKSLKIIKILYDNQKDTEGFNLTDFVNTQFDLPTNNGADFVTDANKSITQHITALWDVLTRKPDKAQSSLIPLPYSFIVPGGRFREIYYWDSYFTMLGLQVSKRVDLIENMVKNFAHLLNTIGHIPNGNRTYYIGRTQPPFFAMMVTLLNEEHEDDVLVKYIPEMEKEHDFWTNNAIDFAVNDPEKGLHVPKSETPIAKKRSVLLPINAFLHRYWDANDTPRPESYKEDVETAHESGRHPSVIYRHIRAAAESGWDFSSRWLKDGQNLSTIHTTDIIPIDLNCLLLNLEITISVAHGIRGDRHLEFLYHNGANLRRHCIDTYCWNEEKGFYFDYDFVEQKQTEHYSLAAAYPLFFNIATPKQAEKVAHIIETKFLKAGGVTSTLNNTGQQWDAPNGWAPLQWVTYKGLKNYGFDALADDLKINWLRTNQAIYRKTGKMTEKYNVYDQNLEAGGGEYPLQDGFGWTNGVYLAMAESLETTVWVENPLKV